MSTAQGGNGGHAGEPSVRLGSLATLGAFNLIFIHGFLSGADTWREFRSLIGSDDDYRNAELRFLTFETRLLRWRLVHDLTRRNLPRMRRLPELSDIASRLGGVLRDHVPQDRPTIIVAHSMGGLAVVEYLASRITAHDGTDLARIAGVVMFGCPHEGSLYLYGLRKRFLRNHDQASRLAPINAHNSRNLGLVLEKIVNAADPAMRIPIWTYAGDCDGVVNSQSARSVFPDRYQGIVEGDHSTLVRPSNFEHDSYIALKARARDALVDHLTRGLQRT
ncbi:alpha/beta fold hydrolase [Nocardia wallacei]|uniref:alpha/beta fold hydrolase n=1 Tax=Nocardia wallacei TaxID=480035 RepID=UPI0024557D16|nr:alpha/beta fold hydrolase [Nocardia wallacei]